MSSVFEVAHFKEPDDFCFYIDEDEQSIEETNLRHCASYIITDDKLIIGLSFCKHDAEYSEEKTENTAENRLLGYIRGFLKETEEKPYFNANNIDLKILKIIRNGLYNYKIIKKPVYGVLELPFEFFIELLPFVNRDLSMFRKEKLKELNYSYFKKEEIERVLSLFTIDMYNAVFGSFIKHQENLKYE